MPFRLFQNPLEFRTKTERAKHRPRSSRTRERERERERERLVDLEREREREREGLMSGERKRTIKLFCPSLSKAIAFVAWEEQRLDLGSISRAFGLDPATLKLNGHFIGRGVDLIALSVTWKSLFSFFSSRGLSTGETDSGALIVDGKLSRIGTKRAHEQAYVENGICCESERPSCSINTRPWLEDEDTNFLKSKRLKERNSGDSDSEDKVARGDGFGLKRKQCLEDVVPLKRIKMAGTNSVVYPE
ncbi:uncharacterized protein LOC131320200 isoform X3 [Rhododendron vialii]|uniref:uncharacterized protein LOC131320200 isoform X3 n=1 Tax=Rhododendron vialii TaxID=182163 RepID=UPI00265E65F5|nr:uncharacterized protein LOC131320200 isoform X3 [Rhododendron vialii]